ncbi:hypothetical protein BRADI_1g07415v3 [Brachypodium distachyon]|uniref:Uncharacterized protein n=1 Tax=Brachypodium distachyon TaxID=15368 RepID=A0A2K2DIH5_BRADI|nr:hypothetical protein BRADI_1g07415v3 [Brachypodium distachyon]
MCFLFFVRAANLYSGPKVFLVYRALFTRSHDVFILFFAQNMVGQVMYTTAMIFFIQIIRSSHLINPLHHLVISSVHLLILLMRTPLH